MATPKPGSSRPRRTARARAATTDAGNGGAQSAGPADFSDPLTIREAKKAAVWIGMATLVVLTIFMAQPLLVIFGGLVFAAMIDGGTRLLGRVLPIGRGWRVGLVLLGAVAFIAWVMYFAGSQIAAQARSLARHNQRAGAARPCLVARAQCRYPVRKRPGHRRKGA